MAKKTAGKDRKTPDGKLVIFVCTGNMCRSPMAEYLLRVRLGPGSGWRVGSAGVAAADGMPASWGATVVMHEIGIDLDVHRSRPVTRALVDEAAAIVAMTVAHREQVRREYPDVAEKVFLLKSFDLTAGGWDIDDPIGLSIDVYRGIRDEIDAALPGLVSFLERQSSGGISPGAWTGGWND